jgi:uncharacterized protein (DUF433 family)
MESTTTIQSINLIATNPKIRGGRPYILDSTVTVADVVIARNYHKLDSDGIADWYGLTLPQVHAALAYYYAHKREMDAHIREQIRRAEQLKENHIGNEHPLLS